MAKKGLKRGLEHLFEDNDNLNMENENEIQNIPVSDISPNPYQPRTVFDEEKIKELSNSIKENGVFQPILVRKNIIGYEIISGERRLRASKLAGLQEIPAIVYDYDDSQMMEVSIIENIQREDLSIIEEALSYKKLLEEADYTQEKLAKKLGISRSHIANLVRITNLDKDTLDLLYNNEISLGHAKVLVGIKDDKIRQVVTKEIIKNNLNVRETEKFLREFDGSPKKSTTKTTKKQKSNFYKIENLMIDKLSTKVQITGENSGLIKINYESEEDLGRIIDLLNIIEE